MSIEKEITKHEARVLIFWASVGFSNSVGGSYLDVTDIAQKLAKKFGIPYKEKDFQKGTKFCIWLTPKAANELWCAAVNRKAKVSYIVKSELFKIRKYKK